MEKDNEIIGVREILENVEKDITEEGNLPERWELLRPEMKPTKNIRKLIVIKHWFGDKSREDSNTLEDAEEENWTSIEREKETKGEEEVMEREDKYKEDRDSDRCQRNARNWTSRKVK